MRRMLHPWNIVIYKNDKNWRHDNEDFTSRT